MIPHAAEVKIQQKIELLELRRYRRVAAIDLEIFETMEHLRQPPCNVKYRRIQQGEKWGREKSSAWFKGKIQLPAECKGKRVYYRMRTGGECLLFVNGKIFSGLDRRHHEVLLTPKARGGEKWEIDIEAYAGHRYPSFHPYAHVLTPEKAAVCLSDSIPASLVASEILVENEETAALFYEMNALNRIALALDSSERRRVAIIEGLYEAAKIIPFDPESIDEIESASKEARKMIAPILRAKNGSSMPHVGVIGHSHLDLAWLWPVKETTRKAARTFSTQMALMFDYPEMSFFQSQPKILEMLEENYPELIPPIKAQVKKGRWEPNGGMYIEPDCNLIGGESMVRQLLVGSQVNQRLFGTRSDTVWLPDTFGFSGAMPQILKKCGIKNFTTCKLKANDTNRFPYTIFTWEGIDGSEVFGYILKGALGGMPYPDELQAIWAEVSHKEVQDSILMPMGYGDGGGGLSREMLEHLRRMKNLEGCMPASFTTASEGLKKFRESKTKRPRWVGELYFEYHRGTYTTQAKTKKYNRKLEFLIREVELLSTMAMRCGYKYPKEELDRNWRLILTNQFHDILPGTSIKEVHDTMETESAQAEKELEKLKATAIDNLADALDCSQIGPAYAVVNTLSWARNDIVKINTGGYGAVLDASGNELPIQTIKNGDGKQLAVVVPAGELGITSIFLRKTGERQESPFKHRGKTLQTPFYRVRFDKTGKIVSLVDKALGREVVRKGRRLNDIYTAEDLPPKNDAWDLYSYYRDTMTVEDRLVSRAIVCDGPLFTKIRSTYQIGELSTLIQEMIFYAHSRRIDFETAVDWQETHVILKSGFALDINSKMCRNEVQFGHVTRDMHTNTSYDQAKFETYAHKWVDVSEGGYGVALLNDCKYGHDTLDDMLSITLLRSPFGPDAVTDKGTHEFTYSLLPHVGEFSVKKVVRGGYELNAPLTCKKVKKSRGAAKELALCSISNPNVILEAAKKAEESDAIIFRVYEAGNSRGPVTITFNDPCVKAAECNLLEEEEKPLAVKDNAISFDILPFEIRTFKAHFKKVKTK
ncbi:alpha-mannosidase [Candidatus Hydrogenedentota bacterium]